MENNIEDILEAQINQGDAHDDMPKVNDPIDMPIGNEATQYLGQKLTHNIGGRPNGDKEANNELVTEKKLTRIGEKIGQNAEIRDGWLDVDRKYLGERDKFYPEDWRFRIRPATVDAIRNWSTIDEENSLSVDEVFNEILKSCITIITPTGNLGWGHIRSWDRLFFVLLIREFTFVTGERKIEWSEDCINCDNPVTFKLESQSLMYDMPDQEVMPYYSQEDQVWVINPEEFDVEWPNNIVLYLPTVEKEANIKQWLVNRIQQKKKVDKVFIKFLPWIAKTISKDLTIAQRQIRDYEIKFKSWDTEMFSFMDSVIRNISVNPSFKLISTCPTCGEEVTSDIQFPNGISSLFNMGGGHKKFGKK